MLTQLVKRLPINISLKKPKSKQNSKFHQYLSNTFIFDHLIELRCEIHQSPYKFDKFKFIPVVPKMLGTSKIPPLPHFDNNYRYHLPHLGPCPPSPQHHIVSRSLTHAKEDIGGATILTTDTKFFVQLDTRGYFQDELEVRTDNGFLIISGESGERGPVEFKTKRSFCRRFLLPDNCKDDELECELGMEYLQFFAIFLQFFVLRWRS